MTNQLLLAYCKENEIIAHEIERELRSAGFKFKHLVCSSQSDSLEFNQKLQNQNEPIILLVSYNYLKSQGAMYNALPTVQNLIETKRLQPLVVDGYRQNEEEGGFEKVETQFDRIGQIIKYMNYWQEEYLRLRQAHRKANGEQKALGEKELKITRSISTQIGEFLRYLRKTNYWELSWLQSTNYEAFFRAFGNEESFRTFAAQYSAKSEEVAMADIPSSGSTSEKIIEPITESEDEVEEDIEEDILAADPEAIISGIPGVDLLDHPVVPQESAKVEEMPSDAKDNGIDFDPIDPEPEEIEVNIEQGSSKDISVAPPLKKFSDFTPSISFEEESSLPYSDNMDQILEEVIEEENGLNPEKEFSANGSKEKSYEILQSIFEDDDIEEEENEIAPITEDKNESSADTPDPELHENQQELDQLFLLVKQAEGNNDLLLAKTYYEKINSLDPNLEDVNFKLGMITATSFTNQEKQAAKYLKKTFRLNPDNHEARYHYAVLLAERLNKPKKAIKHFLICLQHQPDHPFANYDLALLFHQKGELDTAAEYYEQAFHINPELKTKENDIAFNYIAPEEETKNQIENNFSPATNLNNEEIATETTPNPTIEKTQDIKTVLITGATSGIGLATAKIFAKNGYRLILTGRRNDRLSLIEQDLKEAYHSDCLTLSFDVRERKATQAALDQIPTEWGEIDILINNAGLAKGFAPIHEGNIDDWETMIDTNVKGLLYMTRAIAPRMVKNKKGHIINVASTAGKEVYPNGNVYCASKFAVDALTKAMRIDLHKHQIRVSQVAPGHVEETEFALVRFDGDADRAKIYEDFQPLTSRDVAETIYFIATRPPHVNIQDVLMMGTQQASSNHIDRSGR